MHVRIEDDPLRVEVDGEEVKITNYVLYRDGGTRKFTTPVGRVVLPHRMGDSDRTPRLNGLPIPVP